MVRRLLIIYAIVELAAVLALSATIGWGWTLLALLAAFVLGVVVWAPIAGAQLSAQVVQLRAGLKEPRSVLNDSAMVTLAAALVLMPGVVSTALGLLLLAPRIRNLARPALAAIALRGIERRIPLITDMRPGDGRDYRDGRDYIDGEVIDVSDIEPPEPAVSPPAQIQTAPRRYAP